MRNLAVCAEYDPRPDLPRPPRASLWRRMLRAIAALVRGLLA